MKLLLALGFLIAPALATAQVTTYTCYVTSVRPQAIPGDTFTRNLLTTTHDCTPKDAAGLTGSVLTTPASALPVLTQAIASGESVIVTTRNPVAYSGDMIELNWQSLGGLDPIEYAQFHVYASEDQDSGSAFVTQVRTILDHHHVARVSRSETRHTRTIQTYSRILETTLSEGSKITIQEEGLHLGYSGLRKPSSRLTFEYVKQTREDLGRVFDAADSRALTELLGLRKSFVFTGARLSSGNHATVTLSKRAADGLVEVRLSESFK